MSSSSDRLSELAEDFDLMSKMNGAGSYPRRSHVGLIEFLESVKFGAKDPATHQEYVWVQRDKWDAWVIMPLAHANMMEDSKTFPMNARISHSQKLAFVLIDTDCAIDWVVERAPFYPLYHSMGEQGPSPVRQLTPWGYYRQLPPWQVELEERIRGVVL